MGNASLLEIPWMLLKKALGGHSIAIPSNKKERGIGREFGKDREHLLCLLLSPEVCHVACDKNPSYASIFL